MVANFINNLVRGCLIKGEGDAPIISPVLIPLQLKLQKVEILRQYKWLILGSLLFKKVRVEGGVYSREALVDISARGGWGWCLSEHGCIFKEIR